MSAPPTTTTTPATGGPRPAVPVEVDYRPVQPRRMRMRRARPERWMAFAGLCCVCVAFLFPLGWMLSTSLKTLPKTMENPPRYVPDMIEMHTSTGQPSAQLGIDAGMKWPPVRFKWTNPSPSAATPIPENYWRVITHDKMDFPLYTRNTLWVAILSILGTALSSSLVAYGFAKIDFKGRGWLFALMLGTMMIPFPVLMVSLFNIFRWIGDYTPIQMLGTLRPLWLPAWFGSAFNIFLLRQFYITIPDELSEAARIDGCSEIGIWWRIILPLSKPALMVVTLFTFIAAWNNFFGALIYIQHPDQYVLSLGLQVFQSSHGGTEWNLLMAAALLILSPVLLVFLVAQRAFIEGIATTGMKG
jgi:multiple sugar transport system permease protein